MLAHHVIEAISFLGVISMLLFGIASHADVCDVLAISGPMFWTCINNYRWWVFGYIIVFAVLSIIVAIWSLEILYYGWKE